MPSRHSAQLTSALSQFREAWSNGSEPELTEFVPAGLDADEYRQALVALITVDLEMRWRRDSELAVSPGRGCSRPLESYLNSLPSLRPHDDLLLELIGHEYRVRRQSGGRPELEEYQRRFPAIRERLPAELERIEAELSESRLAETTLLPHTTDGQLDRELTDFVPYAIEASEPDLRVAEHFVLDYKLGEGGMGAVYSARDRLLGRVVAIKIVRRQWQGDGQMVQQFLSEARLASRLQHPGICPVYEVGLIAPPEGESSAPVPFIAMKKVEGRTFAEALKSSEGLVTNRGRWLEVLGEIADAVAYAHGRGVIHRDLKPSNVMLGAHGETQVMDWGVAKFTAAGWTPTGPAEVASGETHYGTVKGTWSYMPPEQAQGRTDRIDARADVFALGSILCQILTGKPAYAGDNSQVMAAARAGDLSDAEARLAASAADPELVGLTLKCLARDPHDRPANAAEVADQLAGYRASVERRLRDAEIAAEKERVERIASTERLRAARWRLGLAAAVLIFTTISAATAWLYVRSAVANAGAQQAYAAQLDLQANALRDAALNEPWNDVAWNRYAESRRLVAEALGEADRRLGWITALPALPSWVGDLPSQAAAAQTALNQSEKDREFCLALREARLQGTRVADGRFDKLRRLKGYLLALRRYGVDLQDPQKAVAVVRASTVRDELVGALDELLPWHLLAGRLALEGELNEVSPLADVLPILSAVDPDPVRMRLRTAVKNYLNGNFEESRATVTELAAAWDFAAQPVLTSLLLCDMLEKYDLQLAIRSLRQVAQLNPRMFFVHDSLGLAYLRSQPPDLSAALAHWQATVVLAPESPGAHLNLGNLLEDFQRYDQSKACYLRAIELLPDYAEAHYGLGNLYLQLESYDEAEACFRRAIELRPDFDWAHGSLGKTLMAMNRLEEAENCFRKNVELQPDCSGYHNLALVLRAQQRYEEAEVCFRKALELGAAAATGPESLEIRERLQPLDLDAVQAAASHDYAVLLLRLRRVQEAEPLVRDAIRLKPDLAAAHFTLGNLLDMLQEGDEAEASYREAIRLDSSHAGAHVNLGNLFAREGKFAEAITWYERALQIQPDMVEAHDSLGRVFLFQDDTEKAEACFRTAIEFQPGFVPAYVGMSAALQNQDQYEEAEAWLRSSLATFPDEPTLLCHLGRTLMKQGKLDEAVSSLERGHQLGSQQPISFQPWLTEARQLLAIDKRLQDILAGTASPTNPKELVVLARYCLQPFKKLYRQSAAYYEQAFSEQPELAEIRESRQHRYNAACAAALLAAGADTEAGALDPDEQVKWRKQARQWLVADLAHWTALAQDAEARAEVVERLSHWLVDPDLVSVRDEPELAMLPEEERRDWESLWNTVRALLDESPAEMPEASG